MKPQHVLTELEREPVVFFGCTWSEIMGQLRKAMFFSLMSTTLLAVVLSVLGLSFPAIFALSMVALVIITIVTTRLRLMTIAGLRAGKPLFYEKHHGMYRSNAFIQPHRITYQRERNHDTSKKQK